jgi:predicted oxidoreductase
MRNAHRVIKLPVDCPLIAVRLNILTRKTLNGFHWDLDGRVFDRYDAIFPDLCGARESAGFGGGSLLGYRPLKDTFQSDVCFRDRRRDVPLSLHREGE